MRPWFKHTLQSLWVHAEVLILLIVSVLIYADAVCEHLHVHISGIFALFSDGNILFLYSSILVSAWTFSMM